MSSAAPMMPPLSLRLPATSPSAAGNFPGSAPPPSSTSFSPLANTSNPPTGDFLTLSQPAQAPLVPGSASTSSSPPLPDLSSSPTGVDTQAAPSGAAAEGKLALTKLKQQGLFKKLTATPPLGAASLGVAGAAAGAAAGWALKTLNVKGPFMGAALWALPAVGAGWMLGTINKVNSQAPQL